jgi:hypothetical protein
VPRVGADGVSKLRIKDFPGRHRASGLLRPAPIIERAVERKGLSPAHRPRPNIAENTGSNSGFFSNRHNHCHVEVPTESGLPSVRSDPAVPVERV